MIALRTVLGDVVQVVPSDDDGTGHLRRYDTAGEDTTADGDVACEGALLVYAHHTAISIEERLTRQILRAYRCRCH